MSVELDEKYMTLALEQAKVAQSYGEIPVGAIVVCDDKVVGVGHNAAIMQHDPSAHAEMMAIRDAGKKLENYRLVECTLYVTLEPCPMCAGLLVHSRIKRLVFGATDLRTGSAGSLMNIVQHDSLNHQLEVTSGVLQAQCSQTLSDFFRQRREEKKRLKQLAKEQS